MKQYKIFQILNIFLLIFLSLVSLSSSVKLSAKAKGPYDNIIATPPPLDYNDIYQQEGVNFLQSNEAPIPQPTMNYQAIDPNQVQYIVDPLMSKKYYTDANQYEPTYLNTVSQVNPSANITALDYETMIKNAQNIANSGQNVDKVLTNEENAYSNYFKQLNNMEYNNVINSNLDKNTINKAYSEMFNPETNSLILNQLNNNKYDYNDLIKNLNSTNLPKNQPVIDIATDKNQIQNQLKGFYKQFDSNQMSRESVIAISNKTNQNTVNTNLADQHKNETKIEKVVNKQKFPRFKMNEKMDSQVSLDSIFSGMEEEEKDRLIQQIKAKNIQRKHKLGLDLVNCQNNCKTTCDRVKNLKKLETIEVCLLKCNLACSNNILNQLL